LHYLLFFIQEKR